VLHDTSSCLLPKTPVLAKALKINREGSNMSRDIKAIKKDILDQFRAIDGEANDEIPAKWLQDEYLPVLDTFEKKDFAKAVRQLAAKGVLKYKKGPIPILQLTEKGANLIH
jgi:gamma-glutamyltranspeptidase